MLNYAGEDYREELAPAEVALEHRFRSTEGDDCQKERLLTTLCQVLNCMVVIYVTDDASAEVETKISSFKQLKEMRTVRYSDVLCERHYAVVLTTMNHI